MGEERSYLWAVSRDALSSYELPKRVEVERTAKLFHSLMAGSAPSSLRAFQEAGPESPASELSQMLLGPVASQLGNKRLIIVADGALQYVPFAALPIPGRLTTKPAKSESGGGPVPLIIEHEIISLPSASTIAVLREQLAGRQPAPKTVAVLADPVFSDDDDRVKKVAVDQPAAKASGRRGQQDVDRATKDATVLGLLRGDSGFLRLAGTRQEAIHITALAPIAEQRQYLDFQASRATAMSGDLSQFKYVHFATHGLIDSLRPELSGRAIAGR